MKKEKVGFISVRHTRRRAAAGGVVVAAQRWGCNLLTPPRPRVRERGVNAMLRGCKRPPAGGVNLQVYTPRRWGMVLWCGPTESTRREEYCICIELYPAVRSVMSTAAYRRRRGMYDKSHNAFIFITGGCGILQVCDRVWYRWWLRRLAKYKVAGCYTLALQHNIHCVKNYTDTDTRHLTPHRE